VNRRHLAILLAVLLIAACRVHVTIWLAGQPVARPPIAGLVLAVLAAAAAVLFWMAWRACDGFRSSPCIRPAGCA
jgi:hypothetical protein